MREVDVDDGFLPEEAGSETSKIKRKFRINLRDMYVFKVIESPFTATTNKIK